MSLFKINKKITIEYLQQPENLYFERKSGKTDLKTVANEVMALANAQGEIVALGIADNGKRVNIMDWHYQNWFLWKICDKTIILIKSSEY